MGEWIFAGIAVCTAIWSVVYFVATGIEHRREMAELEARRIRIDAEWNRAFCAYLASPIKGNDHGSTDTPSV
jgi:hypothetical protein